MQDTCNTRAALTYTVYSELFFALTFKTLETQGNSFCPKSHFNGMLSCPDREATGRSRPKFVCCFPSENGECHAGEKERNKGWRKCLSEEPGPNKDSCHEPRCDETASLSNATAVFSLNF